LGGNGTPRELPALIGRVAATMVLLVVLTGCQAEPDLTPEATARRWMEAGMDGDVQTVVMLSCDAYKDLARSLGEISARNGGRLPDARQVTRDDLAELQFRVVANDGEHALVRTGDLDAGLPLVRERGRWRVCPSSRPTD